LGTASSLHFAPDHLMAELQTPQTSAQARLEFRLQPVPGTAKNLNETTPNFLRALRP
jgi:hypothetical protein